MLWASPPAAGADADGRFDVDSVLVTEFLLSFVGTLAGLKLSSDIAACIHTAQAFGAFSAKAVSKRIFTGFGRRRSACWQRFGRRCCFGERTGQDPTAAPQLGSQPVCGKPVSLLVDSRAMANERRRRSSSRERGLSSPRFPAKKASASCLSKARRSSKNTGALATSPAERC